MHQTPACAATAATPPPAAFTLIRQPRALGGSLIGVAAFARLATAA